MIPKQLILVRHAKAFEKDEFSGADFDRPLTVSGEHSIFIIARYLKLIGIKPDQIFASPALRTAMTAKHLADKYQINVIDYYEELYNGNRKSDEDPDKIHLKVLKKVKKETNTLMIVGHNDDLTGFARYLSGDAVPYMKKGSLVVLSVPSELSWMDIARDTMEVVYYLTPQFLLLENLAS